MILLTLRAPAKLNLSLDLLARRADGYHELTGVAQTVALYDSLDCFEGDRFDLHAPKVAGPIEENLVTRAARALAERLEPRHEVHGPITLRKGIPVGAGLGGGSSDAAAALRLLNRRVNAGLSHRELLSCAASVGSDVALFLVGGCVHVSGRGEQVAPLPALAVGQFVIVAPEWELPGKTAAVYHAVRPTDFSTGEVTGRLVSDLHFFRSIDPQKFRNGLEPAALRTFPDLARLKEDLRQVCAAGFTLSGAGPALFHLAGNHGEARRVAEAARTLGHPVYLAAPLRGRPRIRAQWVTPI